ncbi:MAG: hypothetical protein AAF936_14580 [Pseudomonadota bacterium]
MSDRNNLICIFLLLLTMGACAPAQLSNGLPPEPPQGASRAELDKYAIAIIKGSDGGSDLIYDGELIQAIITAIDHLKVIADPGDEVLELSTRLIAIDEMESSYRLGFFAKMYPSSEVAGDIYPNGICEGYCFRFGSGTNYVVEVDKKSQAIISTRIIAR